MNKNTLYIEETTDAGYKIIWKELNLWNYFETAKKALEFLTSYPSNNRIELWTKAHAETCKGFAPLAYRDKDNKVMISNTFKMFYLDN